MQIKKIKRLASIKGFLYFCADFRVKNARFSLKNSDLFRCTSIIILFIHKHPEAVSRIWGVQKTTTMSSVNKVILIGNVGADPEVRYLDRGVAIANFNLATKERGYVMQNGTQVPDRTDWHAIVLWRGLAEWAERNVRKGMKLYVEGKLQTRAWEKDGMTLRKTEIIAEDVQILHRPENTYAAPQQETAETDFEAI